MFSKRQGKENVLMPLIGSLLPLRPMLGYILLAFTLPAKPLSIYFHGRAEIVGTSMKHRVHDGREWQTSCRRVIAYPHLPSQFWGPQKCSLFQSSSMNLKGGYLLLYPNISWCLVMGDFSGYLFCCLIINRGQSNYSLYWKPNI